MSLTYPDITERVEVDKIDRRQGSEWDIVICDITRTKDAGFLRSLGRLNTFFSRAKNGLYVIGNKGHIDKLPRSQGKWLHYFQREYLKFIVPGEIPPDCQWYQAGQVDLRNAYDFEDTGADSDTEGDNTWGDNTAGDDAGGSNTAENNAWGGNTAENDAWGGNTAKNDAWGGNTAGDDVGGNNTAENDAGGGNTAADNAGDNNTAEDDAGGGNTAEDNAGGGNTAADNAGDNNTAEDNGW